MHLYAPTPLGTCTKNNKAAASILRYHPKLFQPQSSATQFMHQLNLKPLTIITVPEGCMMIHRKYLIHPGAYIQDTDIKVNTISGHGRLHKYFLDITT
jgi:hypothetical protein